MNRRSDYLRCRMRIRYHRLMNSTDTSDTRFLRALRARERQTVLLEANFRRLVPIVAQRVRSEMEKREG